MSKIRFALAALTALAAAGAAQAKSITVSLDGTKLVRVPGSAASVAVGNPMIAGVAMDSSRTVFITGRQWGNTNLFVLDANGNTIMSVPIQVGSSSGAQTVTVFRGGVNPLSYSCANTCERTLTPGDDIDQFKDLNDQVDSRTKRAKAGMKNEE